ncbi:MAG: leucine-rich repeat protein [Bacteroidales bacterium]|nr:leucine-rich repeat protein [Bacteroidales bacterium]
MSNYIEQGTIFLEKKEYTKALEFFQAAIENMESPKDAHLGLAEAYFAMGKSEKGKVALYKAMVLDPNNSVGLSMIVKYCLPNITHHGDTKISQEPYTATVDNYKSIQSKGTLSYTAIAPQDNGTKHWRIDFEDGTRIYVSKGTNQCEIVAPGIDVSYYRNSRIEKPSWNGFKKPSTSSLIIPDNIEIEGMVHKVTKLGRFCFLDCSSLRNIQLPQELISIDFMALYGTNIHTIDIPSSVIKISSAAFPYGLNTIKLHGDPPAIDVLTSWKNFAQYALIPRDKKEQYENAPFWQTMQLKTY